MMITVIEIIYIQYTHYIYVFINIVFIGLSFYALLAGGFTAKATQVGITMFCYYHMS